MSIPGDFAGTLLDARQNATNILAEGRLVIACGDSVKPSALMEFHGSWVAVDEAGKPECELRNPTALAVGGCQEVSHRLGKIGIS